MTEGSIVKRKKNGRFAIVLSERRIDPDTGQKKLWQKWLSFRGTLEEAKKKRTELVAQFNRGEFCEPTKLTLGEWLRQWHKESVAGVKRPSTAVRYRYIIEHYLMPVLGGV